MNVACLFHLNSIVARVSARACTKLQTRPRENKKKKTKKHKGKTKKKKEREKKKSTNTTMLDVGRVRVSMAHPVGGEWRQLHLNIINLTFKIRLN